MVEPREALAKVPIFSGLKRGTLKSLARAAKVRRFASGELLVEEGEEAAAFFVICSGQAQVVKGLEQQEERVLRDLTEGDFFGEMAVLDGFPRSASVRAVGECECVVLARWDLTALIRTSPEVALGILPVLSRRVRECEDQLLP
jgi:CRP/FNR family cyclic AMP-dependent transcriptional regulator